MANKFGRNYELKIERSDGAVLTVVPPLTLEFDITRNLYSSSNVASLKIFNLSLNNRNQIRKNSWEVDVYRSVQLRAGYGKNLPIVFKGNITQAWSVRDGVNFVTTIECFDGGFAFANPQPNPVFPSGTSQQTIIKTLAGNLPHVSVGAIGSYENVTGLGASYDGATADVLSQLTGNGFFIDNEVANCLNIDEVIAGEVLIVSPQSGLLNTPILESNFLHFDMLFEPRFYIGQQILLQSSTLGEIGFDFNGPTKAFSISHRGMISEAVCGDAITTIGLDFSAPAFSPVQRVTAI